MLTADEAEPNDAYTIDPEGSISIIDVTGGVLGLTDADVRSVGFRAFDGETLGAQCVRIFGLNATAAQDLEPECIAVSADSRTAWVTLQENNAIAGNGIDTDDTDQESHLDRFPLLGMYQPDGIKAYAVSGATWLVIANKGDARSYGGFDEKTRVEDALLDARAFHDIGGCRERGAPPGLPLAIARLRISRVTSNLDGDAIETLIAVRAPDYFNCSNTNNTMDGCSDDKGPEPEGVELALINDRTYAFIGLERQSSIVVYDVTDPRAPRFADYASNRDFSRSPGPGIDAGDLGPEGLHFVAAADSPIGVPLLLVANEVSGSTTVWRVDLSTD